MPEKKRFNNHVEALSTNENPVLDLFESNSVATPIFESLDQENQSRALLLASKLDVSRYENILKFGVEIQHSLKNFTHNMLIRVQRNDTTPIRDVLKKLMDHLEMIEPDDLIEKNQNFFKRLFNRSKSSIQEVISQYNRLSKHIDRLSIQLQHAQKGLLADMTMLNELYQLNQDYFHNINIYIAAGELKKQDLLNRELPKLEQLTIETDDPMKKQEIIDLKNSIEWLDKRIYDLQISREISIQTAPQIRLIQQTNQLLVEKIQSSVLSTIPLWQSQISMLVQLNNQRRANLTSRRLIETSEQMIQKNAKMIEITAQDSKKHQTISHSEIDAFKVAQLQLIQSIEETLRVQAQSNEQQQSIEQKIMEIDHQKKHD